jgi:hypothetical protein
MWASSRRKAGDEVFDGLAWDEPATADLDGPQLPSGDQLVNAGAADAEFLGGELDRTQARRDARDFFGFAHI